MEWSHIISSFEWSYELNSDFDFASCTGMLQVVTSCLHVVIHILVLLSFRLWCWLVSAVVVNYCKMLMYLRVMQ